MSDPRIEKLPAWARTQIAQQERQIAELRAALDESKGADPRPAIAVCDPYRQAFPVAWDMYDEVRFALHGSYDNDTRQWVSVRRRVEGEIEISCSAGLLIRAQASNVMHVAVDR